MYLAEQPFGDHAASAIEAASERRRVCFFFNAQLHQMLHAMPTAIELSRDPRFEVHVLAATPRHIELAGQLVRAAGCGPIRCDLVGGGALQRIAALRATSIPPKLVTLALAARRLARFDAVVVPERTSLLLRRLGLRHVRFVHTTHGAGDRAVGFERRIRQFDFVLLAGEKQRRRMLAEGVIREGGYAVVGYQKLDAVKLIATPGGAAPIFPNGRPTVLYNPHCSRALSSWRTMGKAIVDQFAADERYNLIVAPHVKLFDCRAMRAEAARLRSRYVHCPNIHIDLGSTRSLDMSYTRVADLYLGDVSSQVYEFLVQPRTCLFLDAHDADWQGNADYAHWRYGPVVQNAFEILDAIDQARATHDRYVAAQFSGLSATFDVGAETVSVRAARAVGSFLFAGDCAAKTAPSSRRSRRRAELSRA